MTIVYNLFYTLAKVLAKLFFRYRVQHPERIPEEGGLILAVNHQSYFDPPLAGIACRRAVHYLARKSLLKWPFFGPLFPGMNVIPVDRGGNDMSALKIVIRKIRGGDGVVLFPEGTRSIDGRLQPAQPGIGLVIAKTGARVLPMRIFGSYEAFPKGGGKLHLHPITVVVGEPITFSPAELLPATRETYQRLGDRLPNTLSLLSWMKFESPKDPPAAFLKTLDQLSIDAILAHRIYSGRERDIWSESTFYDWKPPVSENILRNNGGFTLARLDLKQDGDNWRVLKQELIPMTANTAEADPSLTDRIAQFRKPIEDADKPLGELAEPIPAEAILTGYLAAIAAIPGTDIAAYSRQSIRSDWPEGMLTASRVFNSLPWTTSIVQMTLTPAQLEKLGSLAGIVYLRRKDLPADQAAFVVTTSRFFASLLAEELRMPASEMRATPHKSEFDYFVDALSQAPKPLSFSVPEGWQFVDPRK